MAARAAAGNPVRVLETACGTGIVARALRNALPPNAQIVATDLSHDMPRVAQGKFALDESVTLQHADGVALPFPDGSFDAVVCQIGMMFYPDKDKGLREACRVLAPAGKYLFSVWDEHHYNPLGRLLYETIGSVFPDNPPPFHQVPFSYTMYLVR